ncbi:MAG: hypothetical protein ABJD11_06110 [Gemmatimonadota bacterium]
MRFNRFLATIALAMSAAPVAASAQADCTTWLKAPPVGGWAQYHGDRGEFKIAVVGQEQREGKTLYRFEFAGDSPQGKGIFQMLVPAFPYQPTEIQEMVVKAEGRPAMKISGQTLAMMRNNMKNNPTMDITRQCAQMKDLGEESVTVPAGTFKTHHFKNATTGDEVWGSHDVPFMMVKAISKGGGTVVLSGSGSDAKSAITEKPMEMPSMGQ